MVRVGFSVRIRVAARKTIPFFKPLFSNSKRKEGRTMSTAVTVYNLGGIDVLDHVSLKHAIHMLHRKVATVRETVGEGTFGHYRIPKSVELVRYVYAKWKYTHTGKIPFNKHGVLKRDNYTCAYCGKTGKEKVNTVDHILPKWQGNTLTWNNAVAACKSCNNKKGGRSPKEAGMKLRYPVRVPSFQEAYDLTRNSQ